MTVHPSKYRGKEVIILGLARSGQAVAKLFHEAGAQVVVNDRKPREESPEAASLEALGIRVICGGHPDNLVKASTALLIKNPGIPYHAEPVRQAMTLGVPVVTEVEVAYELSEVPIIGITGSNGKTTTTSWIGHVLRKAGLSPVVAGNIGTPLCEAVISDEAKKAGWLVVELSSFQLKGTSAFRPRIACVLNLYETHLDYHGTMEDYGGSKAKLIVNMEETDCAVLNADDSFCRLLAGKTRARKLLFSSRQSLEQGVYVQKDEEDGPVIVHRHPSGAVERIVPVSALGIPGSHNVENALAATAVCLAAGVDVATIAEGLSDFRGVEHRTEVVAEKDKILFINDSKATNPTATGKGLDAFDRPVVLIAGGLDRGSDYMELLPYFAGKVKGVVALGETRYKIKRVAEKAGLRQIKIVDTGKEDAPGALQQAVAEAYRMASEGDIVLLSPACASWDMFPSYEERGRIFKEAVHTL
ncbi:UDP-N-acetylmuramoyl-L-alanine--D-glutamate ligase [Xylanibacillus composti]|uniref:UDP-N-acetylmuramoylalanine--D-glutamate ligase n=1 Tax=Xylanibacillus composti TaxID=1572762 RepID=A0A8J4H2Y2_9BACL|nr:UDP-N-acetylmuramoyl-L-alanine--D-glutamate ligase [Xylanibacillus composti]MDT9724368.1 UDP-N-acetylmuramoyl-L-alanine--D-glutamate ligase [Xylanibacillus composti]GIQ67959.1 UDP-N-acetylmuramoylalanine--D-glutamate ligase [Xylanibacillus composti]